MICAVILLQDAPVTPGLGKNGATFTGIEGQTNKHQASFCLYLSNLHLFLSVGVIGDYFPIQLVTWWLFHVLSIYVLIFHPLRAKSLLSSSKLKYIHLALVAVGLLAPLLDPITSTLHNLSDKTNFQTLGYRVRLYPPLGCGNIRREVYFYTVILPSNFMLTLGITFLILVFWKLLKASSLAHL